MERYIVPKYFLTLVLCISWPLYGEETLTFADAPFPPYVVGQIGESASDGLAVEVVQKVFSELGFTVDVKLYPWSRALKMLEFGRAAGTCIVPADPERRPYLVYSQPLFESRELLFYNPDQTPNFVFSGFADLNGLTIGLVDGYAYGAQFERAIADLGLTVERSDTSQENFRKLVAGRIDTAVEDEAVAYALLADNEWMDRLAWSKKIISRYSYHVGLSKSSGADRLLDAVNRVLRRLRESGELGSGYPHLPMGS